MMLDIHKVNGITYRRPALTLIPDQAISTFVRLLVPDALPSPTRPGHTVNHDLRKEPIGHVSSLPFPSSAMLSDHNVDKGGTSFNPYPGRRKVASP